MHLAYYVHYYNDNTTQSDEISMSQMKLKSLERYRNSNGPVVIVIMDGMGIGPENSSNGVYVANTPVLDELLKGNNVTDLAAHGLAVGLPTDDDMGNSEVGHNALGAGRVFSQGAKLVNEAIESGTIFDGKGWQEIKKKGENGGTVHFIGMISDGNVHSHIDHLYALLDRCSSENIIKVRIHGLLDGRDVGNKSALDYFRPLEDRLKELSSDDQDYKIASGGGRMVTTMDRYNADWLVVENGWKAHVLGIGRMFPSACDAIETYYKEDPNCTDQYMDSFVIGENGNPVGRIEDGDAVVFFNFRGDRAIEISKAFENEKLTEFDRVRVPDIFYAGLMEYDGDEKIPGNFLVEPPAIDKTLGEYLCATGVTSYAISETQKYGHVTYFWNGNKSGYIDEHLEKYVEVPSDKITFDLKPWMKAAEITDLVVQAILSKKYKCIRLNYANGDMVAHTGIEAATRIAVETVDLCLGRLLEAVKKECGVAIITADHGNADCMWTEKNNVRSPMVAHTKNRVPFIIKDYSGKKNIRLTSLDKKGLTNVAATICTVLGYHPPKGYDPSLVEVTPC